MTHRALLVGIVGVALLGFLVPYCDIVIQGTWISCSHLPIGAFALFCLLLLLNASISRIRIRIRINPQLKLSSKELIVIYCMMLVGSGIPSFGLTQYLLPTLAGTYYFARPENRWVERCYPYLAQWMVPYNVKQAMLSAGAGGAARKSGEWIYQHLPSALQPGERSLVVGFYESLREGQSIPWGHWVIPLTVWTLLAFALFFVMTCITVILRKQWIENERLMFPLVRLPLEMVGVEERRPFLPTPFVRDKLMWIGFAIPMLVHSINGLHHHFPAFPSIILSTSLNQFLTGRAFSQIGPVIAILHFSIVGFSFLLPADLSFSLWFFFFFYMGEAILLSLYGIEMAPLPNYATRPHAALQMQGAFIIIFLYMLWAARGHLKNVVRKALGRKSSVDDRREPLPYRTAVVGIVIGFVVVIFWWGAAGMSVIVALAAFVLFFITAVVLTRFVSEGGLLFIQAFRPTDFVLGSVGTTALNPQNLAALVFVERVFMLDLRTFLMPSLMDSYRMADSAQIPQRQQLRAVAVAIVVAVISSYLTVLTLAYRYGMLKGQAWFAIVSPQQVLNNFIGYLDNPQPATALTRGCLAGGFLFAAFLYFMRSRHAWWPFHPIGYAMGPSWPMIQLWFSILLGWLMKTLIVRYGGARALIAARPLFLGLVVGEFIASTLWLMIDWLTGVRGYRIFLF